MDNPAIDWARAHCGMYSTAGNTITIDQPALEQLLYRFAVAEQDRDEAREAARMILLGILALPNSGYTMEACRTKWPWLAEQPGGTNER